MLNPCSMALWGSRCHGRGEWKTRIGEHILKVAFPEQAVSEAEKQKQQVNKSRTSHNSSVAAAGQVPFAAIYSNISLILKSILCAKTSIIQSSEPHPISTSTIISFFNGILYNFNFRACSLSARIHFINLWQFFRFSTYHFFNWGFHFAPIAFYTLYSVSILYFCLASKPHGEAPNVL